MRKLRAIRHVVCRCGRLQVTLWALLLFTTLVCVVFWISSSEGEKQLCAVHVLDSRAMIRYSDPDPIAPEGTVRTFLRRWLPRDYFDHVLGIDLWSRAADDADVAQLV